MSISAFEVMPIQWTPEIRLLLSPKLGSHCYLSPYFSYPLVITFCPNDLPVLIGFAQACEANKELALQIMSVG